MSCFTISSMAAGEKWQQPLFRLLRCHLLDLTLGPVDGAGRYAGRSRGRADAHASR
jgi:hypothetical protein